MKQLNGKLIVAAGVLLAVVGLLAFSLTSPGTTMGQEVDAGLTTDVPADDDVGAGATGPGSLPDTGTGGSQASGESTNVLLVSMLTALAVALTGAGVIAARRAHSRQD